MIVGDILAVILICYQVIKIVKNWFSGDVRGLKCVTFVKWKNPLF